jgi:hypothetical protein
LGRWLGIAHEVGTPMTYWILKGNRQIICRSTVRTLLSEEWTSEDEKAARSEFDNAIRDKYGAFDPELLEVFDNTELERPSSIDNDDDDELQNELIKKQVQVQALSPQNDVVRGPDLFHNAEIYYPHGDRNEIARVIGRKRNAEGDYISRAHKNPILDSRIFTIRFADGEEKDIAYNILASLLASRLRRESTPIVQGDLQSQKK